MHTPRMPMFQLVALLLSWGAGAPSSRSEEHTSELQSLRQLVCRLLLEKKKRDGLELLEPALADHHDSEVAWADVLLRAVGDPALTNPGDDVLMDDVARAQDDGPLPVRD